MQVDEGIDRILFGTPEIWQSHKQNCQYRELHSPQQRYEVTNSPFCGTHHYRHVTLCTIMASCSAVTVGQAHKIGCCIATPLLGLTPTPSKLPDKRELLYNHKFSCLFHYYKTVKAIRFNKSTTIKIKSFLGNLLILSPSLQILIWRSKRRINAKEIRTIKILCSLHTIIQMKNT